MGALQCFLYLQWWSDGWTIKTPVSGAYSFSLRDGSLRAQVLAVMSVNVHYAFRLL
jgi:hypothetical protein